MANSASFLDYVGYFFQGYKTDQMNQGVLAVLRGFHYVIVAFLAIVLQQVYDAVVHGTFDAFSWAAWQSYLLPGFILVLGIANEALRKYLNPSVSIKAVDTVPAVQAASNMSPLEAQLGKAVPPVENAGAHETFPKVKPVDIPPDH
jgi:hypothetical protein